MNDEYDVKDLTLKKYMLMAKTLTQSFDQLKIEKIPSTQNTKPYSLLKAEQHHEKKTEPQIYMTWSIEITAKSRSPYWKYLAEGVLPKDSKMEAKVHRQSAKFLIIRNKLYH